MKSERSYIDTSAVAKWYVRENRSQDVRDYIMSAAPLAICWLTVLEMKSLLARRRRAKDLDARLEARIFGTFQEDVRKGVLVCHEVNNEMLVGALGIMQMLPATQLSTLDAIHLSVAREIRSGEFATADSVQADAAETLGLRLISFC